MLVENSFANIVVLGQKMTQSRDWPNGEVGPHLQRHFPPFHIPLRFLFCSDAIFNAQSRQLAVAKFARCHSTQLTEFFRFLGIKQFEFGHSAIPREGQQLHRRSIPWSRNANQVLADSTHKRGAGRSPLASIHFKANDTPFSLARLRRSIPTPPLFAIGLDLCGSQSPVKAKIMKASTRDGMLR